MGRRQRLLCDSGPVSTPGGLTQRHGIVILPDERLMRLGASLCRSALPDTFSFTSCIVIATERGKALKAGGMKRKGKTMIVAETRAHRRKQWLTRAQRFFIPARHGKAVYPVLPSDQCVGMIFPAHATGLRHDGASGRLSLLCTTKAH